MGPLSPATTARSHGGPGGVLVLRALFSGLLLFLNTLLLSPRKAFGSRSEARRP